MSALLTAAQMRACERAAIEVGTVTGRDLMERAGQATLGAILAEWPQLAEMPHRARVLCGPGNNGGDGFVVARLLLGRGWDVEVRLLGDPARMSPDARRNHDLWAGLGDVRPLDVRDAWPAASRDLFVDALFGTGLTRPLAPGFTRLLPDRDGRDGSPGPRVVAVDLPSGLCSDSGRALGGTVLRADLTVTFHTAKPGHHLAEGPRACGRLRVADIGLPGASPGPAGSGRLELIEAPEGLGKRTGHKFDHGHALVLSGGVGRSGAARMAARGALRIGAGLVTLGCPPAALIENAAHLDAIMLRPLRTADALAGLLADDTRLNAVCIGPGLGLDPRGGSLIEVVLASGRACVLDADALTLVARDAALGSMLHAGCVLTPHAGEFARLFPDIAERLSGTPDRGPAFSRVDATREAAARAGCTVLLKGPDTVVAEPGGAAGVNSAQYDRAAPWLATAGSGDVLGGFVAGLLARGLPAFEAARSAAWLHVECARSFGPGLISEDLPEALPAVLAALSD